MSRAKRRRYQPFFVRFPTVLGSNFGKLKAACRKFRRL